MKNFILTPNEKQIMDTLWSYERPLTRGEILEFCTDKTWKKSSIHILLNQMLDKEAIRIAGFGEYNKQVGRTYEPTVAKDYYEAMDLAHRYQKIGAESSALPLMVSTLIDIDTINDEDIEELSKIVEAYKNNK